MCNMLEISFRDMRDGKFHMRLDGGRWEYLRTDIPMKYQDAIKQEGWKTFMDGGESYRNELHEWEEDLEAAQRVIEAGTEKRDRIVDLLFEIGALEKEVSNLKYLLECTAGRLTASDELSGMGFYDARLKKQVCEALGGRNAG